MGPSHDLLPALHIKGPDRASSPAEATSPLGGIEKIGARLGSTLRGLRQFRAAGALQRVNLGCRGTLRKQSAAPISLAEIGESSRVFQIVRLLLDDNSDIIARKPLQPLYELQDHAAAMARNEASGLWGDYGYHESRQYWWATDSRGRQYRFVVEEISQADVAA
jgi:hypothetical protein